MTGKRKLGRYGILGAAALAAAVTLAPQTARAEGPATPAGKGIAGGIMLGAEVVMIPIAIGGVEPWWPYLLGGVLGGAAGGVGGWGVEQTGSTEASVYMLAGGMALVIPTIVGVLNVTAYNTEEDTGDEETGEGETPATDAAPDVGTPPTAPGAAPGAPVGQPATSRRHRSRMPLGLVGVDERGIRPGVPAVELLQLYSDVEVAKYGVTQGTELRVPVVTGSF
jgi:hypothetical protein